MHIDSSELPASTIDFVRRKKRELLIVLSMTMLYFFSFFQRIAVPGTIFDELQLSFAASAGAITGLAAVYLYIYGAMQPVAGLLADRWGAARIAVIGALFLSVGSILFPLSKSLPMLYAARVLVGIGASMSFICIVKAIDRLFGSDHFVVLIGAVIFVGYSGGLVGTYPFARLVGALGWRESLLGAGTICAVALVGVYWLLRKADQVNHVASENSFRMAVLILRNRRTWPNLLIGFGNFAVYFLIQATLGKKFLSDYAGLSSSAAATFTFVMMMVTMCIALTGGFISKLLSNRRKPLVISAICCVLAATVAMLLLLQFRAAGFWFLPCYILLACSSIGSAAGAALIKELNPPEAVGTSVGILNGSCYLAVAIVSNIAGVIMDRFGDQAVRSATSLVYPKQAYQAVFLFCLALSIGSLVVALFIRESYGKNQVSANESNPSSEVVSARITKGYA